MTTQEKIDKLTRGAYVAPYQIESALLPVPVEPLHVEARISSCAPAWLFRKHAIWPDDAAPIPQFQFRPGRDQTLWRLAAAGVIAISLLVGAFAWYAVNYLPKEGPLNASTFDEGR